MKQQTAVEWIEDSIQLDMTIMEVLGLIRQAKEMEKESKQSAMQELIERLSKIMNSSFRPSNYPPRFLIEDIIEDIAKPLLEKEKKQIIEFAEQYFLALGYKSAEHYFDRVFNTKEK